MLFRGERFRGDKANYYDPQNSYLNRVMDRRLGNLISLCLVYLFVARRLNLPLVGVAMPGHFILRLQSPTFTIFVDPFNGGNFTQAECAERLKRCGYGFENDFLPRHAAPHPDAHLLQPPPDLPKGKALGERDRLQKYLIHLAN